MDTAALKNFATRARTELRKEVGGRIDVVLASNSLARVESAEAVRALEKTIAQDGREAVVERVAYTWFNRIIALRFMDANKYTSSAVVSPGPGKTTGQPEVLAEVKAGTFDHAVVPERTRERIVALLSGTLHSIDPQGEAYGLLLEAYCRYWNKSMPFMFEREGDYTELLMPAAQLAENSVRDQAVRALTEEACQQVEVIGWLYQFYISERKDEVFAGFKKNRKAGAAEIPAATQLFTPHWIVQYLVENSLGRLWMLNHPESKLIEQMDYYIKPVDEETYFLKVDRPEDLKVIDPAVGSGHMLTYAFDLLYSIYEEKGYSTSDIPGLILEHNLYGVEIDSRAGSLAAFALTMKAAARRKPFLKNPVQPNVIVLENIHFEQGDLDFLWSLAKDIPVDRSDFDSFWNAFEHADIFGSLIQPKVDIIPLLKSLAPQLAASGNLLARPVASVLEQAEYLSQRYKIVVANPPYMGSGNMGSELSGFLADVYSLGKSDLYAAFMIRSDQLVQPDGFFALVTMQTWMFLSSLQQLRVWLLRNRTIVTLAHLGNGVMGIAFGTSATIWRKRTPGTAAGRYLRLSTVDIANGAPKIIPLVRNQLLDVMQTVFSEIPGSPVAFWVSDQFRHVFSGDLVSSRLTTRLGMSTGSNQTFLRYWWEVSRSRINTAARSRSEARESGARWFPYQKGGKFRKWYGNLELVVDWQDDGRAVRSIADGVGRIRSHNYNLDFIFRQGITWSDVTSGTNAFRYLPPGQLFDGRGSSGFVAKPEDLPVTLGLLNSAVAVEALSILNPTVAINVGEVARLPYPKLSDAERMQVSDLVHDLIAVHKTDWDEAEVSLDFSTAPLVPAVRGNSLASVSKDRASKWHLEVTRAQTAEFQLNTTLASAYSLSSEIDADVPRDLVTLSNNPLYVSDKRTVDAANLAYLAGTVADLVSYAVGCMFGRYSLDEPGLILADQGGTLRDYLAKVPAPSFMPDQDNVLPIVDGPWFEDDIVGKFRQFLRVAFGEEHFQENLKFVIDALGVKDLRDYFIKAGSKTATSKFYDDHVRRYKKRPIYWLFSSPSGAFSALVYLHRYNPSTVSTVLTSYLREYITKLEAHRQHQELIAAGQGGATAKEIAAALKEADRVRKVLVELKDYDHDVLFPLAGKQVALDLDDGVLVNYQKLGAALRDIGLKRGSRSE